MKILLNPTSLNSHMIAVHENQKEKHQLEKEPSLRSIKDINKYKIISRKAHVNLHFWSVLLY